MTTAVLHQTNKKQRGFTLIELLVVIGILAILLSITLIAINPAARFGQANDTKRKSDIGQILNAVGQYQATNTGQLPSEVSGLTPLTPVPFDSTGSLAPLCAKLVTDYMAALPVDPKFNKPEGISNCAITTPWDTGYSISIDAKNRVTVSATGNNNTPITVTR